MPKPDFEQIDAQCWLHSRKLGFSEPSICLHHARIDLGQPIIRALDELEAETLPSKRLLTFKPHNHENPSTLRLKLVESRPELRVMQIAWEDGIATIEMTKLGLDLMRMALTNWTHGSEDFGITSRHADLKNQELGHLDRSSGELWFWGPRYAGP